MSEVSKLEQEISNLQGNFNYYVNQRENAKAQRDAAKKRRNEIKDLNNDLKRDFDWNAREINRNINKIDDEVSKGIKGNGVAGRITTIIQDDQEKEPENDVNLKEAISQLDDEYNALNSYYEQKKDEVSNAQKQINSYDWQIRQKKWDLQKAKAKEFFS